MMFGSCDFYVSAWCGNFNSVVNESFFTIMIEFTEKFRVSYKLRNWFLGFMFLCEEFLVRLYLII